MTACVCVCVYVCVLDKRQGLMAYCGRLVGLIKMRVRKYRVTDVGFLLSRTNMVILPPPASLISTHTHTLTQVQVAVSTHAHSPDDAACSTVASLATGTDAQLVSRPECGNFWVSGMLIFFFKAQNKTSTKCEKAPLERLPSPPKKPASLNGCRRILLQTTHLPDAIISKIIYLKSF